MIVGSLLLIVVAVGLLVVGLVQGTNTLLVASIGASLLAAVALIMGGRQAAAARSTRTSPREPRTGGGADRGARIEHEDLALNAEDERRLRRAEREPVGAGARSGGAVYGGGTMHGSGPAHDETAMMPPIRDDEPVPPAIPQQGDSARYHDDARVAAEDFDSDDDDFDEDPEDEPPIEASSAADIARVSALDAEVLVIDGRPRYHLRGCVHLLGRESEPLPASEAVELGFNPCSVCEPNASLLAAARHG